MSELLKEYVSLLLELKPKKPSRARRGAKPDPEKDADSAAWKKFEDRAAKLYDEYERYLKSPYIRSLRLYGPVNVEALHYLLTGNGPPSRQYSAERVDLPDVTLTPQQFSKNAVKMVKKWMGDDPSLALPELRSVLVHLKIYVTKQEKLAKSSPPEAPENAPFEKYIFAQDRHDVPNEPDTPLEQRIQDELRSHYHGDFRSGKSPLSLKSAEFLKKLGDKGWYADIIAVPDKYEVAYRGMTLTKKQLQKLTGDHDLLKAGTIEKNMKFVPLRGASSWTVSKKVAKKFNDLFADRLANYRVILWALIPKNKFIMNPDTAREYVSATDAIPAEREIIGVGTVKVFRIEYELL